MVRILYQSAVNERLTIDPTIFKYKKPITLTFDPSYSSDKRIKDISHFNIDRQFVLAKYNTFHQIFINLQKTKSVRRYPIGSYILCILYNMGYTEILEDICSEQI